MKKISLVIFVILFLLGQSQLAEARNIFKVDTVPAPPQSIRLQTRKEQTEVNQTVISARITHYQSPLSPDAIINFYSQHLPAGGWQLLGEKSQDAIAMAAFSKDKESLNINAYTLGEGQTDIYISRSVIPEELSPQLEEGQDTPGKDLAWAPRYPGAVRKLYQRDKRTGVITVSYAADAQAQRIIDFYQRKMPDNGWRFVNEVRLAQLPGFGSGLYATLFFKGFRGQCQVSVNKADNFQGLESTAVLINYIPQTALGRMR